MADQTPVSRVAPEVHPAGGGVVSNQEQAATFPGSGSTASEPVSQKVKEAAESIRRKLGGNVTYDNADETGNDHRVDMYPQGARSASRSRDRSEQGRKQRAGQVDPDDYTPAGNERPGRSTLGRGLGLPAHQEHHHSHHHSETGAAAQGEIAPGTGHAQHHHHRD